MSRLKKMESKIRKYAQTIEHPGTGRHHVVAFATDNHGNIISKASNSYLKTHPVQAEYAEKVGKEEAIFLHAEVAALVKCRRQPDTVYIARYGRTGDQMLAAPCPICELAMLEAGVRKVVYTDNSGNFINKVLL